MIFPKQELNLWGGGRGEGKAGAQEQGLYVQITESIFIKLKISALKNKVNAYEDLSAPAIRKHNYLKSKCLTKSPKCSPNIPNIHTEASFAEDSKTILQFSSISSHIIN